MGWLTDILKEVPLSAVLRERLLEAEKEMTVLKEENTRLKEEVAKLTAAIPKQTQPGQLTEQEEQILVFFAKRNTWTRSELVAASFKLSPTKSDYFVEKLYRDGYLQAPMMIVESHPGYRISHKGREYLVTRNLIE